MLGRTALVMIGLSVAGIVLTGGLRFGGASDTVVFVVAAATLAGLAGLVGEATDNLGGHSGPGRRACSSRRSATCPSCSSRSSPCATGLVVLTSRPR